MRVKIVKMPIHVFHPLAGSELEAPRWAIADSPRQYRFLRPEAPARIVDSLRESPNARTGGPACGVECARGRPFTLGRLAGWP